MPDRCPALRRGVVTAPFVDGDVLHDSISGRLFVLNPSATKALQALRSGDSDGFVDRFAAGASIDPTTAEEDLRLFIAGLDQAGLLKDDAPSDASLRSPPRPADRKASHDALYRLGERTIRVVCHRDDIATAFAEVAAPCRLAEEVPADVRLTLFEEAEAFYILENDRVVDRVSSVRGARWALVRELVGEGRGRPWRSLLHASAVMTPKGCLLLCGESGAGKSTLLAALVHAGFPFVADDIVLLEQETGLIWPTPLAISIKEASWPLVGALYPELLEAPIVDFGGRRMRYLRPGPTQIADDTGYPIAGVLFVRYRRDAATVFDRLDVTRSLVLLGEGGSILPDTDAGLSAFLAQWRQTPAFECSYGQLDDMITKLSALTGAPGQGQAVAAV